MAENSVNLHNTRSPEQRSTYERILEDNICPFCVENLQKYNSQPILQENDSWLLISNQWPYEHTITHLLAISRLHTEHLADLPPGAGEDLFLLMKWAETTYQIAAGGLAMRFGDISDNGATVRHLHCHMIVPDPSRDPDQKVRFKIS